MKHLMKIFLLALVVSCADNENEPETSEEIKAIPDSTMAAIPPADPEPELPAGEQIGWWDSLISENRDVRIEAMDRYKDVRAKKAKSQFQDSELIPGFVKTFFSSNPEDFLSVYTDMTSKERETVVKDLASEFYIAGAEYKSYIEEYFGNIASSCTACTDQQKKHLEDIRKKVEADVAKKVK